MLDRWFKRRHPTTYRSDGSSTIDNGHLIQLRQVKKTYVSAAGAFTALKGIDLQIERGGTHNATVRAGSDTGVEVIALDRDEFRRLVTESPATREAIDWVVGERLAANSAARQAEEGVVAYG